MKPNKKQIGIKWYVVFILPIIVVGCQLLKAAPAPDYGFIPHPEKLKKSRIAPFNATWISPQYTEGMKAKKYTKLYIPPISITYIKKSLAAKKNIPRKLRTQLTDEAQEAARYMRQRIVFALAKNSDHPLALVEKPQSGCLTLAIAIVELKPTVPLVTAASTVASVFVPGTGFTKYAGQGSMAIEVLVTDSRSHEVLLAFKDREADKASPFTLRDYQQYSHVRASIDDWALEITRLLASDGTVRIKQSWPITLSPL